MIGGLKRSASKAKSLRKRLAKRTRDNASNRFRIDLKRVAREFFMKELPNLKPGTVWRNPVNGVNYTIR
jgi:hypothetical protein